MKIIAIIFLLSMNGLNAQNKAYQGGNGDGFASNKLILKNINLSTSDIDFSTNIYKDESSIYLQHVIDFNEIEFITSNGARLYFQNNSEEACKININNQWKNQFIIIRLKGKDKIYYKKIIL